MPCIACDYLTSLRCSLWRYATSAKGPGSQMQHKEGGSYLEEYLIAGHPLKRSQSPRT